MEWILFGVLIIVMGMLVDNLIVLVELMQIKMVLGSLFCDVVEDGVKWVQLLLLGVMVIGIMVFVGIGLLLDVMGEFMFLLFVVVGILLLLFWVLVFIVMLFLVYYVFKCGKGDGEGGDYNGLVFWVYCMVLGGVLRVCWLFLVVMIVIIVLCFCGFVLVFQQFFFDSSMLVFYVYYKLLQGSDIYSVLDDMCKVEEWLLQCDEVMLVVIFVGLGVMCFMLIYFLEEVLFSYGYLIICIVMIEMILWLLEDLNEFGCEMLFEGEFWIECLVFGFGGGVFIQVWILGFDLKVLCVLVDLVSIMLIWQDVGLIDIWIDWCEYEFVLILEYVMQCVQMVGILCVDLLDVVLMVIEGLFVVIYQEVDRQILICLCGSGVNFDFVQQIVYFEVVEDYVSMEQLIECVGWEFCDIFIQCCDWVLMIMVEVGIFIGGNVFDVFFIICVLVEVIIMFDSYVFEWGGEYENSIDV